MGQNIELLAKLKDPAARLWYAEATLERGDWAKQGKQALRHFRQKEMCT